MWFEGQGLGTDPPKTVGVVQLKLRLWRYLKTRRLVW